MDSPLVSANLDSDHAVVDALADVWSSMQRLGADLDEAQWKLPTDCPGWSVQDNLAHILSIESVILGRPTPDIDLPDLPHVKNDLGRSNEIWVESFRSSTGAEVLEAFREATELRLAELRSLTEAGWSAPSWTPMGPGAVRDLIPFRVLDSWMHELDMRRAVGRPADMESAPARLALDRLRGVLGGRSTSATEEPATAGDDPDREWRLALAAAQRDDHREAIRRAFRSALLELNRLGYVVDPFIIDAIHFVPQSRSRLFVVAEITSENEISSIEEKPKDSEFFESELRPRALAEFIFNNPGINWRLRDLPALPKSRRRLTSILENLPHDSPEWWSEKRTTYLLNQMSQRHRIIADRMINSAGWSFGTVFRRVRAGGSMAELRVDGIAGCLRTPRGGSGRQILVKAGLGEFHARLLTPRECARLMGADDFVISGSLNQALFGFGDAVCVPVIEWIAQHYLNSVIDAPESRADRPQRVAYA